MANAPTSLQTLTGTVEAVRYRGRNDWHILQIGRSGAPSCRAIGCIAAPAIGDPIDLRGTWSRHPQYGLAFHFNEVVSQQSRFNVAGVVGRLVSVLEIDATRAARIVEHFGPQTERILSEEGERLAEVSGIDGATVGLLAGRWRRYQSGKRLHEASVDAGLPAELFDRLAAVIGGDPAEAVKRNPYVLFTYIAGARFNTIDQYARHKMKFARDAFERVQAGIVYALRKRALGGHTFIDAQGASAYVAKILDLRPAQIDTHFAAAVAGLTEDGIVQILAERLHLVALYQSELRVAERLQALLRAEPTFTIDVSIDRVINVCEQKYAAGLRAEDQAFLKTLLSHKVVCVHGPAAAHHVLLPAMLAELARLTDAEFLLCASTRAGARNFPVPAVALAQALGARNGSLQFHRDRRLGAEMIVVIDADRLTVTDLDALLEAINDGARVVFIGDVGRLPPTGPGWPFADMVNSNFVPVLPLPATASFVPMPARPLAMMLRRVANGHVPQPTRGDSREPLAYFPIAAAELAPALGLIINEILRPAGIDCIDDALLVTPVRKEVAGAPAVDSINKMVQDIVRPAETRERAISPGEPVIAVTALDEFNVRYGDRGQLNEWTGEHFDVAFDGERVLLSADEHQHFHLGYCTTAYQAPNVAPRISIAIMLAAYGFQLHRRALYSALACGREQAFLLGEPEAIAQAVRAEHRVQRDGYLVELLFALKQEAAA